MLNDMDVELIKATRADITQHRLKPFTLIMTIEGAEDPYTGNPIEAEVEMEVLGTWVPMTGSGSSGTDFEYVDGVKIITGDIIADVGIEYNLDGATHVVRDGIRYVIRAIEKLGLGEDNRHFILMRRVY